MTDKKKTESCCLYKGEVEVLDDLSRMMEKAYKKRMIQLTVDMKKILEASVGRD